MYRHPMNVWRKVNLDVYLDKATKPKPVTGLVQ